MKKNFIVSDRDANRLSQLASCQLGNNGESWYTWFRQGTQWYFVCHHGKRYIRQDQEFSKDYEWQVIKQLQRHPGAILICCYPNKLCRSLRKRHLFPDGKGEVSVSFLPFGRGLWTAEFRCSSRNSVKVKCD